MKHRQFIVDVTTNKDMTQGEFEKLACAYIFETEVRLNSSNKLRWHVTTMENIIHSKWRGISEEAISLHDPKADPREAKVIEI